MSEKTDEEHGFYEHNKELHEKSMILAEELERENESSKYDVWKKDARKRQAELFQVRVEKTGTPVDVFPEAFSVFTTHNGLQWSSVSFNSVDEARAVIKKIEEYIIKTLGIR